MKIDNKNKKSLPLSRFRVHGLSGILRLVASCLLGFFALINFALINASLVSAQTVNPLEGNARAAFAGAALFRAQCATCHGADAKGISSIDAPDLTLMWSQRQLSAQDVFDTIRNGIQGSIMPPHDFTDTEIWMLVSHLQNVAVEGVIGLPQGDVANGRQLFTRHCAECHRVKGEGGSLGPDLSSITARRSLESLLTSVRQPSVLIAMGYKPLSLVTTEGESVQGVLKSEDAFSLQMMDSNQRLRGFVKRSLRSIERPQQSLMPAFNESKLGQQDVIDILNYLDSH